MTGRIQTRSTLAVVAREAGVSVPTVSKVLRARADVAPATRARVRAVLDRLGFPPESVAARVAKVNAGLLDVLVHDVDSPRVGALVAGLATRTRDLGISVVVGVVPASTGHPVPPRRWLDQIAARGTCGVVGIMVDFSETQLEYLAAHDIATVAIDPPAPVHDPLIAIPSDDREATRRLADHLIARGHRRIAMLTGDPYALSNRQRVAGFRDAMAAHRLPLPPGHVAAAHTTEETAQLTAELLRLDDPPSALLVTGDHGPAGAHRASSAAGCRIPEDVLLVGFDDLPMPATQVPGLSVLRRPVDAVVHAAISVITRSASASIATPPPALDIATSDRRLDERLPAPGLLRSPDVILCGAIGPGDPSITAQRRADCGFPVAADTYLRRPRRIAHS